MAAATRAASDGYDPLAISNDQIDAHVPRQIRMLGSRQIVFGKRQGIAIQRYRTGALAIAAGLELVDGEYHPLGDRPLR